MFNHLPVKTHRIYKLYSPDDPDEKVYIGRTTRTLKRRLYYHKQDYKGGHPITSREIIQYGNVKIDLLEEFECCCDYQANAKEFYWMYEYKDKIVNKIYPFIPSIPFNTDPTTEEKMIKKQYQHHKRKRHYEHEGIDYVKETLDAFMKTKLWRTIITH